MTPTPDILIIDDDVDFCHLMAKMFNSRNIISSAVYTWKDGWNYICNYKPKLVLLDNYLPDGLGMDQITQIKKNNASTRVMVVSGESSPGIEHRAIAAGADYFCGKPFNFYKLTELVQFWIKKSFSSTTVTPLSTQL